MPERRYDENEVAEVFKRSTEAQLETARLTTLLPFH
jgi:hypothetical protein